MNNKYLLFNFNSVSHMSMSLSKFFLFLNIDSGAKLILYSLGHFFISIAQYFIKYSEQKYKYISSSFGMAGHTCLLLFMFFLIRKGNREVLSFIFFLCQFGMIDFYLNHMLTHGLNKVGFKRLFYTLVFLLLVIYYIYEGLKIKNFSKYATILVGIVYIDLIIYLNTMGAA